MKYTERMAEAAKIAKEIVPETKTLLGRIKEYADFSKYDNVFATINFVSNFFSDAYNADMFDAAHDGAATKVVFAAYEKYSAIVNKNVAEAKNLVRDSLVAMALKFDTTLPAGFYSLPEDRRNQLVLNAWNRVENDEYDYKNTEDLYSAFISELDYLTDVLSLALAA